MKTFNTLYVNVLMLNGINVNVNKYISTLTISNITTEIHEIVEDYVNLFHVDTTSNSFLITIPLASENQNTTISISDRAGNASVNNISLEVDENDFLKSPSVISTNYGTIKLISDGINTWIRI